MNKQNNTCIFIGSYDLLKNRHIDNVTINDI